MPVEQRAKIASALLERAAGRTTKRCPRCQRVLPIEDFGMRSNGRQVRSYCPPCQLEHGREAQARWYRENPDKARELQRRTDLRIKYGIDPDTYDSMLAAQGGGCAICGADNPRRANVRYFAVDHDHETDAVRGLLCHPCNLALGAVDDNRDVLLAMIGYLEEWKCPHKG